MDDYDGVSEHGLRREPALFVVILGLYLVRFANARQRYFQTRFKGSRSQL